MRLTDLNPHWISIVSTEKIGLTFRCPCCPPGERGERGETTYLGVMFTLPIDPSHHPELYWPDYMAAHPTEHFWQRSGESFDDLTLTPSIDASKVGHWHGFITNGEVR